MFRCYLDDSGTSGLPVVTMAGFIAPEANWERLEPQLDAILNRYDVSILHTKEFHDTKTPFDRWNKIKKRSFADELFACTHGQIAGLSVAINRKDFEAHKRADGGFQSMSAIGVCFSVIMTRIVTDPQIGMPIKRQGVSFFIEGGNNNNSEIEKFFLRMASHSSFEGVLRSIEFIPKDRCRAIQLADFLAFYSRRYLRNHARFSGKFVLPSCPFLQIIQKHGPLWIKGGYGAPQATGGHLDHNLPNLDALVALVRRPLH